MNQLINMIIRQVMNQLVRRGVSAGFDQASKMGKRRKQQPMGEIDDSGNPTQPQQQKLTPEQRQQRRALRQQRRQAKQASNL